MNDGDHLFRAWRHGTDGIRASLLVTRAILLVARSY